MSIVAIERSQIGSVWAQVEGYVDKALQRQKPYLYDSDFVRVRCLEGDYLMLVAQDNVTGEILGCTFTYIEYYPLARVCNMLLIGGKRGAEWIDQMDKAVENLAYLNECAYVIFSGRQGWKRRTPKYNLGHQIYVKGL